MAVAIHTYIRPAGSSLPEEETPIVAELIFYGRTEAEAEASKLKHMAGCGELALAEGQARAEDVIEDDAEAPLWGDVLGDEEDDQDGDEEDEETEEDEEAETR
jgi:hypothetical protein